MRGILFLVVLLALLYVGLNKVQSIRATTEATGGEGFDLGLPSESPFASSFETQYLCRDVATDEWKMFYSRTDSWAADCSGPFIDTRNLCVAMTRQGVERVELADGSRKITCD